MSDRTIIDQLEDAICGLIPEGMHAASCLIPEEPDFEYEEEALVVRQAGDYRRREFCAGRVCARSAIAKLGVSAGPITADEDGLPLWPNGVRAVISHSRGYCAALATNEADFRAIGLDLEMTNRLSPAAIERVMHASESSFAGGDQRNASLLFCAKEAFYKAQYPEWHTSANFQDLALAVNLDEGIAKVTYIHSRFPEELRRLSESLEFRFRFFGDFVVCVCWLNRG